MKQAFLLIALCLLYIGAYGQPPKKFNYQGIARGSNGQPLANQALGLRISILDSNANGPVRYSETHTVTTNAYGLYNVAVGGGTIVAKEMDSVAWGAADKYMLVEIDPTGGTSYTSLGATQLLSVPYALYSENPGPQGPPGVLSVTPFSGSIANPIAASNTNYVFAGPTATITTTLLYNRVTAVASGVLGMGLGGPITIRAGMCYQLGAGTVTNFAGINYTEFEIGTVQTVVSASASTVLVPGTYTVGFCVRNNSASALDDNDYVNGWIMLNQN